MEDQIKPPAESHDFLFVVVNLSTALVQRG